jgi:hypothetical protein
MKTRIACCSFKPTSLRLALSTSAIPVLASSQRERFIIVFDGFGGIALLIVDVAEHAEATGVDIAREHPYGFLLLTFNYQYAINYLCTIMRSIYIDDCSNRALPSGFYP